MNNHRVSVIISRFIIVIITVFIATNFASASGVVDSLPSSNCTITSVTGYSMSEVAGFTLAMRCDSSGYQSNLIQGKPEVTANGTPDTVCKSLWAAAYPLCTGLGGFPMFDPTTVAPLHADCTGTCGGLGNPAAPSPNCPNNSTSNGTICTCTDPFTPSADKKICIDVTKQCAAPYQKSGTLPNGDPICDCGVGNQSFITEYTTIACLPICPQGQHRVNTKIINAHGTMCIQDGLTCPAGFSSIQNGVSTLCYSSDPNAASSVPATSSVPSTSSVPAVPKSCPAGQNMASGIDATDGLNHVRCYDTAGNMMSDNGVNTAAGQAAADKAAADKAAADKAAADAAKSSVPPTSSVPSMPSSYAASGIFYTPGTITGGKSLTDVATNFLNSLKNTSIITYLSSFVDLSGMSGYQCPTWDLMLPMPVSSETLHWTIDFLCWPLVKTTLDVLGILMLFFVGFKAYQIAFR